MVGRAMSGDAGPSHSEQIDLGLRHAVRARPQLCRQSSSSPKETVNDPKRNHVRDAVAGPALRSKPRVGDPPLRRETTTGSTSRARRSAPAWPRRPDARRADVRLPLERVRAARRFDHGADVAVDAATKPGRAGWRQSRRRRRIAMRWSSTSCWRPRSGGRRLAHGPGYAVDSVEFSLFGRTKPK